MNVGEPGSWTKNIFEMAPGVFLFNYIRNTSTTRDGWLGYHAYSALWMVLV